jgi:hypothetical protein
MIDVNITQRDRAQGYRDYSPPPEDTDCDHGSLPDGNAPHTVHHSQLDIDPPGYTHTEH